MTRIALTATAAATLCLIAGCGGKATPPPKPAAPTQPVHNDTGAPVKLDYCLSSSSLTGCTGLVERTLAPGAIWQLPLPASNNVADLGAVASGRLTGCTLISSDLASRYITIPVSALIKHKSPACSG